MGYVVIGIVVLLVLLWLVLAYNGLVQKRQRTNEAWSQIDVELKRRHDLIPNLVETVKGYAAHERGTLDEVTQARANAVAAGATGDPAKIGAAENMLSQSLRSLFAVSENYPDLKAVATFTNLQEQLTATEDKIEFARRYYNGNVRDYNTALQTVPTSFIASMFRFQPVAYFQADAGDREVPQVSFGAPAGGTGVASGPPPADPSAGPPPASSGGPPPAT
jgi:LemA protein